VRALVALPDGSWGVGGEFIPWEDGEAWFGPAGRDFGVPGTPPDPADPAASHRSAWAARVDGNSSLSCGMQ
jgi:hypothetical protein